MNPESPIPETLSELLDWLDVCRPELSPRSADDVPAALARGAERALIDWMRVRKAQRDEQES